jgi:hypothetical protein
MKRSQNNQFVHFNYWKTRTKSISNTVIWRRTYVVRNPCLETSEPLDFDLLPEKGNVLSVRIYEGNIH